MNFNIIQFLVGNVIIILSLFFYLDNHYRYNRELISFDRKRVCNLLCFCGYAVGIAVSSYTFLEVL